MKTNRVLRTVIWSRRDQVSVEYCQLEQVLDGFRLWGTVLTSHDEKPLRLDYMVLCNESWVTRSVRLVVAHDAVSRELTLVADDQRRWWNEGDELTAVVGCVDIDISLSPSTNTLPVRRLSLARGERRDVTAAWVRFPELTVEPLTQCYERTGERLYRYSSGGGAFTADIEVDELGLVVRYPPLWDRVT